MDFFPFSKLVRLLCGGHHKKNWTFYDIRSHGRALERDAEWRRPSKKSEFASLGDCMTQREVVPMAPLVEEWSGARAVIYNRVPKTGRPLFSDLGNATQSNLYYCFS